MKYRMVSHGGSRGWQLGIVYDLEPQEDGTLVISEQIGPDPENDMYEQVFWSRNKDGLFESKDEGTELLVPIE